MTQVIKDILQAEVIEFYVKNIEPSDIAELGSPSWFDAHERLQKLHQQAILEAREVREESVKEMIMSYNKMPILVHEAICVSVWREKILPLLLKITPEPKSVFVPYMVLFHEATAVEFLETLLYHADCCEVLAEHSLELIDYSTLAITRLLAGSTEKVSETSHSLKPSQDLEQKEMTLAFNIGIKCISIIGCIAQYLDKVTAFHIITSQKNCTFSNTTVRITYLATNIVSLEKEHCYLPEVLGYIQIYYILPLSATSSMFFTYDIPVLLVNIIEKQPWTKQEPSGKILKYEDCKWQERKGEGDTKVTRAEAQTWLALRHLLLDPRCPTHYDINEYRKNQLSKVQQFLHDILLDQLSPLVELKLWLAKLAVSNPPVNTRRPLLLEVVPQIKQRLLEKHNKRWKKIATKNAEMMFCENEPYITDIMKSLNRTYDLDILEALIAGPPSCVACGQPAARKCSRCKASYCGRDCQVRHWPTHRKSCEFASSASRESK